MHLANANLDRAITIAELVTQRFPPREKSRGWKNWTRSEGLIGTLRSKDLIEYRRPNNPHGFVLFRKPKLVDVKNISWEAPIITRYGDIESHSTIIQNSTDASYKEEITHSFKKTRTVLEGIKIGVEVALTAYVKGSYAGVEAGAELSAKISAEYSKKWGEATTETDTASRTLSVPPNSSIVYMSERSVNKLKRRVTAQVDFDYEIAVVDNSEFYHRGNRIDFFHITWTDFDEFVSIAKGEAPADKPMWIEFQRNRVPAHKIEELERCSNAPVELTLEYDNVATNNITITPYVSPPKTETETETPNQQ